MKKLCGPDKGISGPALECGPHFAHPSLNWSICRPWEDRTGLASGRANWKNISRFSIPSYEIRSYFNVPKKQPIFSLSFAHSCFTPQARSNYYVIVLIRYFFTKMLWAIQIIFNILGGWGRFSLFIAFESKKVMFKRARFFFKR